MAFLYSLWGASCIYFDKVIISSNFCKCPSHCRSIPWSNYQQKHVLDLPFQGTVNQPSQASHLQKSIHLPSQQNVEVILNADLTVFQTKKRTVILSGICTVKECSKQTSENNFISSVSGFTIKCGKNSCTPKDKTQPLLFLSSIFIINLFSGLFFLQNYLPPKDSITYPKL